MTQTLRPTLTENLFFSLFNLEPERPNYYLSLYTIARNIFMSCDLPEKIAELDKMIKHEIELPYDTTFQAFVMAYYNPRFLFSKKAYCKIGDNIEYITITRYEFTQKLELIKRWIMDECSMLARHVRFTAIQQVKM